MQRVAGRRVEHGRGRLLDHLLVATLDRAVALAQVDDRPVLVGGDLHLDVAGRGDESLDVEALVAERGARLAAGQASRPSSSSGSRGQLDPAAAPAARRLQQQRVADSSRRPSGAASPSRPRGRAGPARRRAPPRPRARSLSPPSSITSAGGPTKMRPCSRARAASCGLSDEEAVAGVERVAAGAERGLHDRVGAQVALAGRRRADAHRPVGAPRGQPVEVGLGGADDALEPELPAGAHDAHGDLAAVGDEHALDAHARLDPEQRLAVLDEHGVLRADLDDRPGHAAGTEFIIFMTSIRQTIVSGSTRAPTSTNGWLPGASAR